MEGIHAKFFRKLKKMGEKTKKPIAFLPEICAEIRKQEEECSKAEEEKNPSEDAAFSEKDDGPSSPSTENAGSPSEFLH